MYFARLHDKENGLHGVFIVVATQVMTLFRTTFQEDKRTLERELARAKVSANRVATVVANEWKDENDKVMPVKQWLEERRLMQVSPAQKFNIWSISSIYVLRQITYQMFNWVFS